MCIYVYKMLVSVLKILTGYWNRPRGVRYSVMNGRKVCMGYHGTQKGRLWLRLGDMRASTADHISFASCVKEAAWRCGEECGSGIHHLCLGVTLSVT